MCEILLITLISRVKSQLSQLSWYPRGLYFCILVDIFVERTDYFIILSIGKLTAEILSLILRSHKYIKPKAGLILI